MSPSKPKTRPSAPNGKRLKQLAKRGEDRSRNHQKRAYAITIKSISPMKSRASCPPAGRRSSKPVLDGVYTAKDDYPTPPVDSATLKIQIDGLSAAIAA